VKTSSQQSVGSHRISEPPVEYGGSLGHPERHLCFNEDPDEHDHITRKALPTRFSEPKHSRERIPTSHTRPRLNVLPSSVTDAAVTTSTPETRHVVAFPYTIASSAFDLEPDILSNSIPNSVTTGPDSCSAGADEGTSQRAGVTTTKKSSQKQRSLPDASSSRSVAKSQISAETTGDGTIAELNRDMPNIEVMMCGYYVGGGVSALAYTFDSVAGEIPEDENDPHDFTQNEYCGISPIELEKRPAVDLPPKPRLPVRPPIWAQVRRLCCGKVVDYMVSSLDRKCASPLMPSGAFKAASINPMTLSKGIFSAPTPLGHSICYTTHLSSDTLLAVIYSTMVGGLSSRMGERTHVLIVMDVEVTDLQRWKSRSFAFEERSLGDSRTRRPIGGRPIRSCSTQQLQNRKTTCLIS
jgi:hypothetical protein